MIQLNRFFYNFAKFREDLLLVIAVAAAIEQTWRTADVAAIFIGPLDDFCVMGTFVHDSDSLIARLTALSWYCWASSPSLPAMTTVLATFGCSKFRWLPLPP